jgi:hypothetical protein
MRRFKGHTGRAWSLAAALLTLAASSGADEPAAQATAPRYTFSYPFDKESPAPRGGITQGAPVDVDTDASPGWVKLHEHGLDGVERDRRAILAMVGTYRVSFDFLEVANFDGGGKHDRPYQSWGTERIYLDRDEGGYISLVHLLEMRIVQPDGKTSEPFVTKHWRQDWRYEPKQLVEYKGNDRWQRRNLSRQERSGNWSQAVEQVDESPRYGSVGHWQHTGSFSTWISGDTWRPLPRREWSVRKDYQVLEGTNRVTLNAGGWTQEENNLKLVLTTARAPDPERPYVAREYGIARYERLRSADFAAADEYFERTRKFWDQVHDAWDDEFARHGIVDLKAPVDQSGSFQQLFAYADEIAEGKPPAAPAVQVIKESMHNQGAE